MQIQGKHLDMIYPLGKQALRDISLDLNSLNLIGMLGPNGAGKFTLMKLLVAGLIQTKGEITVAGQPLQRRARVLNARPEYLPQSFGPCNELTVYQVLNYMAAMKDFSNSKAAIQEAIYAANLEQSAHCHPPRADRQRPRQAG